MSFGLVKCRTECLAWRDRLRRIFGRKERLSKEKRGYRRNSAEMHLRKSQLGRAKILVGSRIKAEKRTNRGSHSD